MQEVDAAVTWEPYLSEGRNVAHGHLLTDTSERPGLIGDCLATKASIFNDRKQEFRAVARAWDAAVRYVDEHPAEANAIIARNMGDWLEDPARVRRDAARRRRCTTRTRTGNTSARPSNPVRSIKRCNTRSMSGPSSGCSRRELTPADVIAHGI